MSVITLEQVEKAQQVLDFLEANPHLWAQHIWLRAADNTDAEYRDHLTESHDSPAQPLVLSEALSCGTAGCFAGWYAMHQSKGVYFPEGNNISPLVLAERGWESLEDWVARDLGLEETGNGLATAMFEEDNSMDDLRRWVDAMRESYRTGIDVTEVADDRDLIR